ncbi:MAG: glycosyltransferase family 2 protein [Vicinamibacterales bacterium]
MGEPVVTVIVATYNRKKSLDLTVQSLLQQDLTDFEAWIIGDACTDGSEGVVQSFRDARLHWFNLEHNTGHQSGPNNEGLRRARGRYVAYLGHDDLWLPWHLSTLVTSIETQRADWIHAFCAMVGPDGPTWAIGAPPPGSTYRTHCIPPSSWLHRRDLVMEIGGWRHYSALARPADLDIQKRLQNAKARMVFSSELTVLKFPSWEFPGIYKRHGDPPHAPYLKRLTTDPKRLQADLYRDIALSLARLHATRDEPAGVTADRLWRLVGRSAARVLGEERWPVATLRQWGYRRRFERDRKSRGL